MKVLHLNSEKSWRGGEQQMANLCLELRKKNVESIIAARRHSESIMFAKKNGFEYLELDIGAMKIKAAHQVKSYISKNNIKLIHTHTANAHTIAVLAGYLGSKANIVVSKRTDFPVKSLYKFNYPKVKKILCVSNKIKEIVEKDFKKNIVHTVYSGIDTKRFDTIQTDLKDLYDIPKDKILIGNCSAIAPHKDYYTFVDTAKILNKKSAQKYHFIIMGDGPLEAEIKNYAKELPNITFTGFMSNIHELLKSFDLFLMTSQEEGLGTSLLDSMICKVPIVATRAGGIPEIVIHEKTGLTTDVGNSDELAKLVEERISRLDLTQNAYQMVIDNFSREVTAAKTLKHYNDVLSSH
ncbi:MAG: glycosyltransferase [Bacteriovoracaceae bacterium]|jgi:glycosyltransferase involved in cell wall biosynthesis|nr:glycosyltransferase [Bacteriovoracaceae bacterium]